MNILPKIIKQIKDIDRQINYTIMPIASACTIIIGYQTLALNHNSLGGKLLIVIGFYMFIKILVNVFIDIFKLNIVKTLIIKIKNIIQKDNYKKNIELNYYENNK